MTRAAARHCIATGTEFAAIEAALGSAINSRWRPRHRRRRRDHRRIKSETQAATRAGSDGRRLQAPTGYIGGYVRISWFQSTNCDC